MLATSVQDRHREATDLPDEVRQAGGDPILGTDPPNTPSEVVGLNKKKFTDETLHQLNPGPYIVHLRLEVSPEYEQTVQIRSGQSTSVAQALTKISPEEIASSQIEPAASTPTPALAFTPETNHTNAQPNKSSSLPEHWQDSARVIRPKIHNLRNRSSVAFRSVDVKRRLIELWHQSLVRTNILRRD